MAITIENLFDLVVATDPDKNRGRWTDLTSDLQKFVAMRRLLKKKRRVLSGGQSIQFNLMMDDSGAAQNVGLYHQDSLVVQDRMKTATVPWRHTLTNWSMDLHEQSMNRGPEAIVDLILTRKSAARISLVKLMEDNFWGKPVDSDDDVTPWGIFYWLVANATKGFNGGAPSGWTTVAGLSPTTYPRWRNWTDTFAQFDEAEGNVAWAMREAFIQIDFQSPVDMPNYRMGDDYGIYVDFETILNLERLLQLRNENLGNDFDSKHGRVRFRGVTVEPVPHLNNNPLATGTNPIIMLNWGDLQPHFLKDWVFKEVTNKVVANQHNVVASFIDTSWNLVAKNRRPHAILYKV